MLFMDKKEEVLDIELTPHGKKLLSMGKMRPVYYAFFDDNIMYDAEYGGVVQDQNAIQQRIAELTPQLQTQYKFTSDTTEGTEVDFGNGEKISTIAPLERNVLVSNLGNSRMSGQNFPAIDIRMLSGDMSTFDINYRTTYGQKKIPQINMNVEYKIEVSTLPIEALSDGSVPMDDIPAIISNGDSPNQQLVTDIDVEGNYLTINPSIVLADIVEANTDFKLENFDIEVFEVGETLIPLSFAKNKKSNVVNGILIDSTPEEDEVPVMLSPSNVEYYFDIFVDSNIDREIISSSISRLKSEGLYTDKDFVKEDNVLIKEVVSDIYGTNVSANDTEDCQ